MLLLIALTLKGSIAIAQPIPPVLPIPIPIPITAVTGGGGTQYSNISDDEEKRQIEQRIKIQIEDSEIIAIVELTLRNFII